MIEVRTGNRAKCKDCGKPILYDEMRIVEVPPDNSWPDNYHIYCYKQYLPNLVKVLQVLVDSNTVKHGPHYEMHCLEEAVREHSRMKGDKLIVDE